MKQKLIYTRDDNGSRCLWPLGSEVNKDSFGSWESTGSELPLLDEGSMFCERSIKTLKELTKGLSLRKGKKCIINLTIKECEC